MNGRVFIQAHLDMSKMTQLDATTTWRLTGQISPGDASRQFVIDRSPFTLGRNPAADMMIPASSVSSSHAELSIRQGNLWVEDVGSTNGTYVNGQRISQPTPLRCGDLIQFAEAVFRVEVDSPEGSKLSWTVQTDSADRALAMIQLDRMMTERAVNTHFQPIVQLSNRAVFGYEMLARSRLIGLYTPSAMFDAAAALDVELELTRMLRFEGLQHAAELPEAPLLFANTHPIETNDAAQLTESLEQLRESAPGAKIVLEIHECAVTEPGRIQEIRNVLRDLDMELAYDDFGAGHARLVELVEVPPDYLKFDISLVREIHRAPAQRQQMVASLVDMVRGLGIKALAEGVEQEEEHEACVQLGFECGQGFLYGHPDTADAWLRRSKP